MNFRCYFYIAEGHIVSPEEFVAETETDALKLARAAFAQRGHYSAFELWQGTHLRHTERRTVA